MTNTTRSFAESEPAGSEVGLYRTRLLRFATAPRLLIALVLALVASCQTVPITGRVAVNSFTIEQDMEMGGEAYTQMMGAERLLSSGPEYELVNRAMNRLVAASTEFDPGFAWEVSVIDNPEVVNAFALPGGKMAVYTGILPVAQGETGLAVVMGHEIGHALARHGTQRLTAAGAASGLIGLLEDGNTRAVSSAVNDFLQLGYGRSQELEADHIGLILMSKAGYDPREAEAFWGRMAALGGSAPLEWFSTHPANDTRIEEIRARLPEAMALFEASTGQ